MLGFGELPAPLRRYVLAVGAAGPVVALGALAIDPFRPTGTQLLWVALLTALATIAERHPLHLTHKTSISVASAAYMAMILTLPPSGPGLLALLAIAGSQLLRRRAGEWEAPEGLFNISQGTLYVAAGAFCFGAARDLPLGPQVGDFGTLGAVVLASSTLHLVNTALVAGAVGVQLGTNPLRVWWHNIALDLMAHVTLTALGTFAALLAADQPLVLPFLALPGALVYHALRQTTRLRVDTHEALASLVEVIELRDPYTAGHSRRVAVTARALALRLGLTNEEADAVEQAGRVHDIGKAALDSAVLTKSGRLTGAEWEQVRRHPVHGANVVERFAAYRDCARLVRHHHERWDGVGYPDGLAGEAIPLGARVIAVADAFDALTSDRPYRTALSVEAAIETLEQGAGVYWDPRVVATMVAYLGESTRELPAQAAAATPAHRRATDAVIPMPSGLATAVAQPASPGSSRPLARPATRLRSSVPPAAPRRGGGPNRPPPHAPRHPARRGLAPVAPGAGCESSRPRAVGAA